MSKKYINTLELFKNRIIELHDAYIQAPPFKKEFILDTYKLNVQLYKLLKKERFVNDIKANEIKIVDIDDLVENPRNTNMHSEKQIGVLAKIIEKVGFRNPIVVSNRSGFIVTGHGRLEAAKLLDMKEVPVSYQDFENEAEEYKYLNADNEIARYAEFDKNKFLDNLKEMDFDIADIDFEEFGLIDFNFDILDEIEEKEKVEFDASQADKQFILEVKFSNEMEMMDIHDDLHHRGYIVKVKN